MIYLYNEDIGRIRKILKKADDYNFSNLRSETMARFIHEIGLLLDKGVYVDKNEDRIGGKR